MTRKEEFEICYKRSDELGGVLIPVCPDCGELLNVYEFGDLSYVMCECFNCKAISTGCPLDMKNIATVIELEGEESIRRREENEKKE